jgi:hypothetical protein
MKASGSVPNAMKCVWDYFERLSTRQRGFQNSGNSFLNPIGVLRGGEFTARDDSYGDNLHRERHGRRIVGLQGWSIVRGTILLDLRLPSENKRFLFRISPEHPPQTRFTLISVVKFLSSPPVRRGVGRYY